MVQVSPSILAADFANLQFEIEKVARAGADMLHVDVMDGHFVPNISIGFPVLKSIRKVTELFFDVHLMFSDPLNYLPKFAECGADGITFHFEAVDDPAQVISLIHTLGKKAGVSLKPATPASELYPYLNQLDMVLVMTVEPGFGGQSFMDDMLPKIRELRAEANRRSIPLDIEVDGGITEKTAPLVRAAGANVLVAGSFVFHSEDPAAAIASLKR